MSPLYRDDDSSDSDVELPPVQVFNVVGADKVNMGNTKFEAQLDRFTNKNVIPWGDLQNRFENILFVKDKNGNQVPFLQREDAEEV
jgi:hypothetical protein